MNIDKEIIKNVGVLRLSGRLGAKSVQMLRESVSALLESGTVSIVIDMGGISFIDSSGLGSLVACQRSANNEKGEIRLASLQDQIQELVKLTRLNQLFEIFDDCETAVKSY